MTWPKTADAGVSSAQYVMHLIASSMVGIMRASWRLDAQHADRVTDQLDAAAEAFRDAVTAFAALAPLWHSEDESRHARAVALLATIDEAVCTAELAAQSAQEIVLEVEREIERKIEAQWRADGVPRESGPDRGDKFDC